MIWYRRATAIRTCS